MQTIQEMADMMPVLASDLEADAMNCESKGEIECAKYLRDWRTNVLDTHELTLYLLAEFAPGMVDSQAVCGQVAEGQQGVSGMRKMIGLLKLAKERGAFNIEVATSEAKAETTAVDVASEIAYIDSLVAKS